jgi:hypothetical protein
MYTGSRQIVQQQDAGCVTSGMQDARHWKCKMQDNEDTLGMQGARQWGSWLTVVVVQWGSGSMFVAATQGTLKCGCQWGCGKQGYFTLQYRINHRSNRHYRGGEWLWMSHFQDAKYSTCTHFNKWSVCDLIGMCTACGCGVHWGNVGAHPNLM